MNMLIHEELKIVRHTLDVLRSELALVRMSIRDLGPDDVDYALLQFHMDLTAFGVKVRSYEDKLKEQI